MTSLVSLKITHLKNNAMDKDTPIAFYKYAFFDKHNQQHMYIISLAMQLGWETEHLKTGCMVADLELLGRFIANSTQAKKPLKKQTKTELQKTIFALEQVLTK
jgi:hypothetical protein